jgi:hypothetical protein
MWRTRIAHREREHWLERVTCLRGEGKTARSNHWKSESSWAWGWGQAGWGCSA